MNSCFASKSVSRSARRILEAWNLLSVYPCREHGTFVEDEKGEAEETGTEYWLEFLYVKEQTYGCACIEDKPIYGMTDAEMNIDDFDKENLHWDFHTMTEHFKANKATLKEGESPELVEH